MKKRIYLAMLAACLALTVAGCGESGKTGTDTAETQENTDGKTAEAGVSRLVSVDNVDKYITLGEYKGLILDNTVEVITDDDVQARIDQELQDKAEAVSDGAQEGDLVTVNYVGTIDGETFDGGTANNYDFIIGNGGMFQEFEQGVIGMKKGETKEISVEFPSDYSDSTLAGKKADYKVTVQNVRRAPELTDEWVTKNTDYTTVEEYREEIYKTLEKEARESAGEVLKNTAWNTVLENTEVKEYPEADVENAISVLHKSMEVYAKQADMTLEEFVESQGISQDAFDEQSRQYAEGKVKQNLIVQGIMDAEGLSLDDKESLKVQEELVKQMGAVNLAELVDTYGQSYVDESVGLLRVEDFIVKNAKVSEKSANGDTVADNAEGAAEQAEDSASGDSQTEESEVDQNLEDELGTEAE